MAPLASAIDEDGQLSRSPSASRHTLKLFTNGDACNHSFAAKIAAGIRQGERRPVHHQRQLPVGEARLSIWLDDEGGNPEPPGAQDHGPRRVSPHAYDHIRRIAPGQSSRLDHTLWKQEQAAKEISHTYPF